MFQSKQIFGASPMTCLAKIPTCHLCLGRREICRFLAMEVWFAGKIIGFYMMDFPASHV